MSAISVYAELVFALSHRARASFAIGLSRIATMLTPIARKSFVLRTYKAIPRFAGF